MIRNARMTRVVLAATVACGLGMAVPATAGAATNPPPAAGATHATTQHDMKPAATPKPTAAPKPKPAVVHKPLLHKKLVHKPLVHKPLVNKPAPKKPVNGG